MVVCPVCEHQQAFGIECEICGKDLGDLGELGPPPAADTKLEGLEVTVPERIGEIAVERVGELEVTSFAVQGPVALEAVPDLDLGRANDVGAIPVERMADLAEDRAADDGVRTAAPTGAVTCRYCRNVQAAGLICNTCGMRLPKVAAPPPEAVAATAAKPTYSRGDVRCKACGAPAMPGERCSECGALAPLPT
ncbi:MAG: hypothetical protein JNM69_22630 [Archangium sp.]|nr:hypothetical protein [Archangium sp.]